MSPQFTRISPAGIPDSSSQSATKSLSSSSGDTSRAKVVSGRSLGAQKTVTSIAFLGQNHWYNPLQQNAVTVKLVSCVTGKKPYYSLEDYCLNAILVEIVSNQKLISYGNNANTRYLLGRSVMTQFLFHQQLHNIKYCSVSQQCRISSRLFFDMSQRIFTVVHPPTSKFKKPLTYYYHLPDKSEITRCSRQV